MTDLKLSDAQERVLISLVERSPAWVRPGWSLRQNTLESLSKLGLVEYRFLSGGTYFGFEYRATEEGIALCNSMGD